MKANKTNRTAERLRLCREEAHETLDHVGQLVGVNKSTVLRWECGSTAKINLPTLQRLAQHFGVDAAWLAGEDVPRNGGGDWLARHALPMDDWSVRPAHASHPAGLVRQNAAFSGVAWDDAPTWSAVSTWDDIHFWLRVTGDSMAPLLNEGDLILVRRQPSVESGNYAVLLLNDDESVIRRVEYGDDWIELQSVNPYYPPRRFCGADMLRLSMIGLVIESRRKFI